MSVLRLVRSGGQVVGNIEELIEMVGTVIKENVVMKAIIEKQGAIIVSVRDEMGVMSRKLDTIQDEVRANKATTNEIKHTKFYGQTTKLLPEAVERAKRMTGGEVRKLIHRTAKSHPSGRRKGYTVIYEKLNEVTGINVYDIGQISLKKSDGIDGWKKDPSYINTILKKGLQSEVAVICMQILVDK